MTKDEINRLKKAEKKLLEGFAIIERVWDMNSPFDKDLCTVYDSLLICLRHITVIEDKT
jgi:hypothetical protein